MMPGGRRWPPPERRFPQGGFDRQRRREPRRSTLGKPVKSLCRRGGMGMMFIEPLIQILKDGRDSKQL